MNSNRDKCMDNIDTIISTFDSLGLVIHPEKSIFQPTEIIEFLGFIINTTKMTISLTSAKQQALVNLCTESVLEAKNKITIRKHARLLGNINL